MNEEWIKIHFECQLGKEWRAQCTSVHEDVGKYNCTWAFRREVEVREKGENKRSFFD